MNIFQHGWSNKFINMTRASGAGMMDARTQDGTKRLALIFAVAALALVLALTAGCPKDDNAAMAQQMRSGRQSASTTKKPYTPPPGMDATANAAESGAAEKPGETPAGTTEQPGGETTEAGEYTGPKVDITDLTVKAPYPEYTGQGRYDLSFNVELEESTPAGVWQLRALNDAGDVVGTLEQFLTLSYGWKKPLDFKALYCSEIPTKVEMRLTDKQPVKEEGEQTGGGAGRGAGGGGGGAGGEGKGPGRGAVGMG